MSFVQVFEFRTSDLDAVRQADAEWRQGTEGKRTVRREILAARPQPAGPLLRDRVLRLV